jgi:hypothetical protein
MKRVGLCILLGRWLRSKRWILDDITINMCSNTAGKWVGVGYGSDFWEAHCITTFTEHPRWMSRLLTLDTNDTRLQEFKNLNMKTEFTPPLPRTSLLFNVLRKPPSLATSSTKERTS